MAKPIRPLRGGGFTGRFEDGRLDKYVQKADDVGEDGARAALEGRVRAELAARRREQLEATGSNALAPDDTERAAWARLLGDGAEGSAPAVPGRRRGHEAGGGAADAGGCGGDAAPEFHYNLPEWGGRPEAGAPAGRLEVTKAGALAGPPVELWRWAVVSFPSSPPPPASKDLRSLGM